VAGRRRSQDEDVAGVVGTLLYAGTGQGTRRRRRGGHSPLRGDRSGHGGAFEREPRPDASCSRTLAAPFFEL
jgi:hypothetical protein